MPTFRQALAVWLRVAVQSFGGPAGQIAVMHRLVVEEKRWVSERRFLHALNYAMLLPGPEAQQLATYLGWLMHGVPGGLVAGGLFILPGFLSILGLSILYAGFYQVTWVQGLFFGLKPAVMAVVVEAVIRIGRRALGRPWLRAVAALAFVAIFFFNVPFPWIILTAAGLGWLVGRRWPPAVQPDPASEDSLLGDAHPGHTRPTFRRALRVVGVCLTLWFAPLLALALWLGRDHVLVTIGLFFSKTAVVTFGGAYAVLTYIAQQAVHTYGWLSPAEMLDGLGLAETTPGPLIQVVQFVGFLAAYRQAAPFSPLAAGVWAALVTTWVTYVPCFLWIFLGAPYIERLRAHRGLNHALSAITAAVVGVILNLALWFSLHVIFGVVGERHVGPLRLFLPDWRSLDVGALLLALGAAVALFRFKAGMLRTLLGSAVVGLLVYWLSR